MTVPGGSLDLNQTASAGVDSPQEVTGRAPRKRKGNVVGGGGVHGTIDLFGKTGIFRPGHVFLSYGCVEADSRSPTSISPKS